MSSTTPSPLRRRTRYLVAATTSPSSGEAHAALVGEQLADGADAAGTEVIDVIDYALALAETHEILGGRDDVAELGRGPRGIGWRAARRRCGRGGNRGDRCHRLRPRPCGDARDTWWPRRRRRARARPTRHWLASSSPTVRTRREPR